MLDPDPKSVNHNVENSILYTVSVLFFAWTMWSKQDCRSGSMVESAYHFADPDLVEFAYHFADPDLVRSSYHFARFVQKNPGSESRFELNSFWKYIYKNI